MHDFCFTYPYGIVVLLGGLVGYLKRGSSISLLGGVGAGIVLLFAGQRSLAAYHKGTNSWISLVLQTVVSLSLTWVMGERYLETSRVMPAGTVAFISGVMSLFYLYKMVKGGNRLPNKKENTS